MRILGVQFKINADDFLRQGFEKHVEKFYRSTDPGDMIVFPEDIGLLTAFREIKADDLTSAMQEIYSRNRNIVDEFIRNGNDFVKSLFLSLESNFRSEFYLFFSEISRKYGVYTVACNNMPENGRVYNTCYVFDPTGNEIFRQRKVHLTDMEISLFMDPGDPGEVRTFTINGIRFGIAISLDAFCPDYIYMIRDADIFLQPDANPVKWNSYIENGRWQPDDWMDSAYYVAQRLPHVRYAVNPMMVGNLFGIEFEGQSSVAKKAERSDSPLGYIGNIPATGFEIIMPVEGFNPSEFHDRGSVENLRLEYPEGMIEVEIQ